MAPEVLPNETIIPDVARNSQKEALRKARLWADVPHRYFVDEFIHQAKLAGPVDDTEVWAIYELLQKAEKRGYKETKPNVPITDPASSPAQRRQPRNRGDEA